MRRVFIAAVFSKKDRLTPYLFSYRRIDTKADRQKEFNPESGLFQFERTASSQTKIASGRTVHQSCVPEPPDSATCCGSGCTNCVWIEYVAKLLRYYRDRPSHEILSEIDRVVSNVGFREFVKTEIRARAKC